MELKMEGFDILGASWLDRIGRVIEVHPPSLVVDG